MFISKYIDMDMDMTGSSQYKQHKEQTKEPERPSPTFVSLL